MRKPLLFAAAIMLVTTVSGCNSVDLSAVSQFAAETSDAKAAFDDLATDWLETCIRRTEYSRTTQSELRVVPDDSQQAATSAGGCSDASTFANQWRTRNDIVVAYVRALGGLADVGTVPKNTGELAASLADVGLLPSAKKDAFADLAGKIASAAIEGQQRRAIGDFAKENDDALKVALGDLDFISARYDELLINESVSLDELFRDTLRAQTVGGTNSLPEPVPFQARRLDFEAIREEWESRRSSLRQRHEKVKAYQDALATILKAHAEIVSRASMFNRADLANTLKGYATSFGDDVTTLARPEKK